MEQAINKSKCNAMEDKLADMLLAPESVSAKVFAHVAGCEACTRELAELRATMTLLDTWQAPAPSPFFMTRMNARLNEERQAEPAGWFERLRTRFVYGNHLHARPLVATALTVVLLLGGGTYLGIVGDWDHSAAAPPQAAVVHDLQVLDNNAQLLDQLESLSNNDNTEN
jgi:anti-sigma factor RsiW